MYTLWLAAADAYIAREEALPRLRSALVAETVLP